MAIAARLHALAADAPVGVFPAIGVDAAVRVAELGMDPSIELAASPRHASVLLVAGKQREADGAALARVHDQIPHPRATLCWGADAPALRASEAVPAGDDPGPALRALHHGLFTGERASEADLLPDEPAHPWRGRGDHGQGGEGMMGGTPYGRMMPMPPMPDLRDGLTLDVYTATVGPYYPLLPPGLTLEVTWQGDVVQSARVLRPPLAPPAELAAPFQRALAEPIAVAALERARAAHHLACIARVLELLELPRLARRCHEVARRARTGASANADGLAGRLRRAGAFAAVPPGLGRRPEPTPTEVGGPARRAAGEPVDARAGQPAYRELRFAPVSRPGGDVRARLHQWLDEVVQALDLAERARYQDPARFSEAIESPWGALGPTGRHEPAHADYDFTELLIGREWHEALLIVASFDVAALGRMIPWRPSLAPGTDGGVA